MLSKIYYILWYLRFSDKVWNPIDEKVIISFCGKNDRRYKW